MTEIERQPPPRPRRRKPQRRSLVLPILLVFVVVAGLLFLFFMAVLIVAFSSPRPVTVSANSVLEINLSGIVAEYSPPTPFDVFFENKPLQFHQYLSLLDKAASDDKIKGIYLRVGLTNLGWAQFQELRRALQTFRDSGKWIVADGEIWREQEYFLASVADEVFMTEDAMLFLDGFMSKTTFYAKLMEKYGVNVQVQAFGEYKSFADSYRNTEMSKPHREATAAMLDGIQQAFVAAVSESRGLEQEAVEGYLNDAVYQPAKAVELDLLDKLLFPDLLKRHIGQKLGLTEDRKAKFVQAESYAQTTGGFDFSNDAIAVVYAIGTIQPGSASSGLFGDSVIGADAFVDNLAEARRNPNVKAIVVRIDSPGGAASSSALMWRELRRTAEMGKPIIASMGNVAASGGYFMAMGCDSIVAEPTTITGSIGVVAMRFNLQSLYQELLINAELVQTAPSADFLDSYQPLDAQELKAFRERTYAAYRSFVSKAAESRGISYKEMEEVARGRVWIGADARDRQLVDRFGGLGEAVALASEKAGLSDYRVIRYPLEDNAWSDLFAGPFAKHEGALAALQTLLPQHLRVLIDAVSPPDAGFHLLALSPAAIEIK